MIEEVLLDSHTISPSPAVETPREYVSALILNEDNAGLVLEKTDRSRWQLVGGKLLGVADPMAAAQHFLRERTGFEAQHWFYLGSYQQDTERAEQIGHFFFARDLQKGLIKSIPAAPNNWRWKWASLIELRRGLLDGRFLNIGYAVNVSLSLLMLPQLSGNGHSS